MKRHFLIFALIIPALCQAQCVAEAGNDTFVCLPSMYVDTMVLGGNPTATGGVPPYTYTWETIYIIGNFTMYASDFLDDTTLANPSIIDPGPEELAFYLTVTDSVGNACMDSVKVLFSHFGVTLQDKMAWIELGDSVQLYSSVGVSRPPATYFWTPDYNLSNQNISFPYASPDTFTAYQNLVTDSLGCQMTDPDLFEVYIMPVGINASGGDDKSIIVYPNPNNGVFTVQGGTGGVEVLDVFGRPVPFTAHGQTIDISHLPKGVYIVRLGEAVRKVVLQ